MSDAYLVHAFDMINVGDIDLVRQVRELASRVVIGVLTDEQIEATTGRRPIIPLPERLTLALHLRGVHAAVVHDDHSVPEGTVVYAETGNAAAWDGAAVELAPRIQTTSSMLRAATVDQHHDRAVA